MMNKVKNMNTLEELNQPQREAAETIEEHVRIIAGAGSGKTRVLMNRIAYLVNEAGILPWRILAITFTNKAANEMKERLARMLGDEAAMVKISTIHSFCVRLLRMEAEAAGYPKNFTILDPEDQKAILRPYYKSWNLDVKQYPYSRMIGAISNFKTRGVDPEMAAEEAFDPWTRYAAQLYKAYEERRKEMRAMDFDDLLLETRRLLRDNEEVREKWSNRYDYIHVDEFQDVDPVQYEIVRLLTGPDTRLCVVGDPDQTIYTWRGASVDIILGFERDFPESKTVILNENYRSTKPILEAANAVIAHNTGRIEKDLFTRAESEFPVETHQADTDSEEATYIARKITELHEEGAKYGDFGILYRSNFLSRPFERLLRSTGIPYIIYGGIRFYERAEVKDMLSYLQLLSEPAEDDPERRALDLAVTRVINQPKRGIGARTIEKLEAHAREKNVNLLDALQDLEGFTGAPARKLAGFADTIAELKEEAKNVPLENLVDLILDLTGYAQMLKDTHEEGRLENIMELKNDIKAAREENPELTLAEYLQEVTLFSDRTDESGADAVRLMTVHAAKGLEFDNVFVAGLNEGVFPNQRAMLESGKAALEEERRLMYVAMTRARKRLFLTWNTGYSFIDETNRTPSRFLKELPGKAAPKKSARPKKAAPMRKAKPGRRGHSTHFSRGDIVDHKVYGEGVVVDIQDDIASVAFGHSIGVKNLNIHHPSLRKK